MMFGWSVGCQKNVHCRVKLKLTQIYVYVCMFDSPCMKNIDNRVLSSLLLWYL